MISRTHRALAVVLLVMMVAPAMAQQVATPQATPQAAPQPTPQSAPQPATPVPPAAPPRPAPRLPPLSAPIPPAAPLATQTPTPGAVQPQPVATPTFTLQNPPSPVPPPYASALRQPTAPVNFRVEVQVTDRLDAKILGQETFTALMTNGIKTKISRTTPTTTAALEVTVSTLSGNPPPDAVYLRLGAQFKLAKGVAGEKDPGVDIGQEVSTNVGPGKPVTVIDMSSGSDNKRRFVVQVTVTRVPVE